MYFRNYGLQNTCLDKCLKSPVSEHSSTVNMLQGPQHTTFIISLWGKWSMKVFLLVISKFLGLLLHKFSVDDKYSLCNSQNIQIQLLKEIKNNF